MSKFTNKPKSAAPVARVAKPAPGKAAPSMRPAAAASAAGGVAKRDARPANGGVGARGGVASQSTAAPRGSKRPASDDDDDEDDDDEDMEDDENIDDEDIDDEEAFEDGDEELDDDDDEAQAEDDDEAATRVITAPAGEEQAEEAPTTFQALGIVPSLVEACSRMGFKAPTPIQRQSIPVALTGRDIIGLAETGSGKTASFALPVLQKLLEKPQPLFALILTPTRELAYQISEQFEALGSTIGVKCCVIVGGMDMTTQAIALSKKPHILIATPGRIVDHLENTKGFSLRNLKFLIMDEADRILNMDFEEEVDKILKAIPKERNTYLYSATMTSKVAKLQRASLRNPVKIEVATKYQTVGTLVQQYLFIPARFKDCYLTYALNQLAGNSTIIFTMTCANAQRVALMLRNLGFPAIPLHGQLTQPKRLGALNKFKEQSRSILVATDVASRGLDIPHVDLVINYDIPTHSKDYIHRVGRTARAGRSGRSITMVTQYDVELFQRIEQLINKKMELYESEEEQVLMLLERTSEAQRMAITQMRDENDPRNGKRRGHDRDDDTEERQHNIGKHLHKKPRSEGGGRGGGRGGSRGGRGGNGGRGYR